MRVGIIGDVHGHYRELRAMVNRLRREGVDRIILLGDLIDRGPESMRCLRYAQEEGFEVVKGNHEDAYVRVSLDLPKPGREYVEQPEYPAFYRRLTQSDIDWMRELPLSISIPELNVTVVHGGVAPGDEEIDEFALRTRYLDEESAEPLRGTRASDVFWAQVYDGRFGTIVFGHESHYDVTEYPHALAVDGEGFRRLHAVIITEEDARAFTLSYSYGRSLGKVRKVQITRKPDRFHEAPRQQARYVRRN